MNHAASVISCFCHRAESPAVLQQVTLLLDERFLDLDTDLRRASAFIPSLTWSGREAFIFTVIIHYAGGKSAYELHPLSVRIAASCCSAIFIE